MSIQQNNNENSYILTEGKHEGSSIGEVLSTHDGFDYLTYLSTREPGVFIEQECWEAIRAAFALAPKKPECTRDEGENFQLRFGKHSGKTIGELATTVEGQSYLDYLTRTSNTFPDARAHAIAVMKDLEIIQPSTQEALDTVIDFGKHKGKSIAQLITSYQGRIYVEWLCEKDKNKLTASLAMKVVLQNVIMHEGSSLAPSREDRAVKLRFGLFKGKTLASIIRKPRGKKWMASLIKSVFCKNVQRFELEWYLENE